MKEKVALVLCGGGSQGAYEYGVWKFLREINFQFDIVVGTSIGGINGAMICYDGFEECGNLWRNASLENVFENGINFDRHFLSKTFSFNSNSAFGKFLKDYSKIGGANIEPFKKLVRSNINAQKVLDSNKLLGIVTTNKKGLQEVRITNKEMKNQEDVFDYLFATSAAFPIFPIYKCSKGEFLDGGWKNNLPIDYALELGAKKIIAVRLYSFPKVPQKEELMNLPCVTVIEPTQEIGSIMKFKKSDFEKSIELGYYDAAKIFGKYKGFIFTFEKFEFNEDEIHSFYLELLKNSNFYVSKISNILNLEHRFVKTEEEIIIRSLEIVAEIFNINPYGVYKIEEFKNGLIKLIERQISTIKISKLSINKIKNNFTTLNFRDFVAISYFALKHPGFVLDEKISIILNRNTKKAILFEVVKFLIKCK